MTDERHLVANTASTSNVSRADANGHRDSVTRRGSRSRSCKRILGRASATVAAVLGLACAARSPSNSTACVAPPRARPAAVSSSLDAGAATSVPIAVRVPQAVGPGPEHTSCPQVTTDAEGHIYEAGEASIAQLSTGGAIAWVQALAQGTRLLAVANSTAGSGTAAVVVARSGPVIVRIDSKAPPFGRHRWQDSASR